MSEDTTPEEELHARREALVDAVVDTYVGKYAHALGTFLKSNDKKITSLREALDERLAEAVTRSQEASDEWAKLAEGLAFPVKGGKVVPWTMRISTEELWLGVGDNEMITVDYSGAKAKTCWFAAPDKDGRRECHLCRRRIYLPDSDAQVSVIPDDPKELAAALMRTPEEAE